VLDRAELAPVLDRAAARCDLGLGQLLRRLGRTVAADDALARAARSFAEMGLVA
jgi:hypothetical protein